MTQPTQKQLDELDRAVLNPRPSSDAIQRRLDDLARANPKKIYVKDGEMWCKQCGSDVRKIDSDGNPVYVQRCKGLLHDCKDCGGLWC